MSDEEKTVENTTDILPPSYWESLTEEEKKLIEEFKVEVKDYILPFHSDYFFSRFLFARKWDLKLSAELFISAMKVRQEEDLDNLLETFPNHFWYKTLSEYWPISISPNKSHFAKDGGPVMYERIGMVHPKLADLIPVDVILRYHLYCIEIMENEGKKLVEQNGYAPGIIWIEDLQQLEMHHVTGAKLIHAIQAIASRDEVSYPESIRKVYIVNAPTIFNLVWNIITPFIEEHTKSKFSFGASKDFIGEWEQIIGLDNLPKYLGGNGDWSLPEGGHPKAITPKERVYQDIKRKDLHFMEFKVAEGQTLNLEIALEKGSDIGFALYIKGTPETELSKTDFTGESRVPECCKEVEGEKLRKISDDKTPYLCKVTAPEDLTYVALFDNQDSRFTSREIATLNYFT